MTGRPRGWIFDLEGTLCRGSDPVPGAAEAIVRLRERGETVRILTNTTSLGRRGLRRRLARVGIACECGEIYNPGAAAAGWLVERGASARLLVASGARDDFAEVEQAEPPEYVVAGDLGEGWTFAVLNDAFRALYEQGAGLLALAGSRFWRADNGLRLDVGPFVAALEHAAGVRALTFGKPAPAIFQQVLASFEPGCRVTVVGDDPETDIAPARDLGLETVLVRTGKFEGGNHRADRVVDSVAALGRG